MWIFITFDLYFKALIYYLDVLVKVSTIVEEEVVLKSTSTLLLPLASSTILFNLNADLCEFLVSYAVCILLQTLVSITP